MISQWLQISGPWWGFAILGGAISAVVVTTRRICERFFARDAERESDRELLEQETRRYYDEQGRGL